MKLLAFLARYVRRYWRWGLVAFAATIAYAASTVVLIQLLEPVFSEVLQLGADEMPAGLGAAFGAQATSPAEPPADGIESASRQARFFLDRILNEGYERLKVALGVTPDEIVYFVPILFVAVFMLRSFSDFLNGYAFQQLGLGATTDLRNDLYRRTLDQSSRFHAEHPSGELVSRVVNDVGVATALTTVPVSTASTPAVYGSTRYWPRPRNSSLTRSVTIRSISGHVVRLTNCGMPMMRMCSGSVPPRPASV